MTNTFLVGVNDSDFMNTEFDTFEKAKQYAEDIASGKVNLAEEFGESFEVWLLDVEERDENGETVKVTTVYDEE